MATTEGVAAAAGASARPTSRHWLFALPLLLFISLGVAFAVGLTRNPREIPSALIGQTISDFELPPLPGRPPGLASRDLVGEASIVNVFASWCTACLEEHPYWMKLSAQGAVSLHGLNYKDDPDNALDWLAELGDPYHRVGSDRNGRVAIDFGVYGVPETFVIDRGGRIAYKHIGPVDQKALDETILPLVRRLQSEASGAEGNTAVREGSAIKAEPSSPKR
ncbi:DsbE family thiol:disulfide interchange protein [Consotaella salsifontis]|uniref:Cytochrome c biogenesis protein CcmG, thiol:disulfide interchange protein DsbE n=1 Tax=Consotaella salsifontis TaxID=1365950 RepID=A0A1T4RMD4_9HYPH|nr:DsbE family thiol:disulfide interchange protein [Consotaella salsifontis]SKA17129.1 cytochrome c biogenesis protein CcmG, thiol:disulfide interchange protein DsbE [Consotaella salsifontis]